MKVNFPAPSGKEKERTLCRRPVDGSVTHVFSGDRASATPRRSPSVKASRLTSTCYRVGRPSTMKSLAYRLGNITTQPRMPSGKVERARDPGARGREQYIVEVSARFTSAVTGVMPTAEDDAPRTCARMTWCAPRPLPRLGRDGWPGASQQPAVMACRPNGRNWPQGVSRFESGSTARAHPSLKAVGQARTARAVTPEPECRR